MLHEDITKICGIYWIFNKFDGKCYIGQSKNCNKRFKDHKIMLSCNKHSNPHLQSAWNLYGSENFKFEVLEECEPEELNALELEWLNYFGGYNNSETYNQGSITGGSISEEVKLKIGRANKYKRLGKPLSAETKLKIGQANSISLLGNIIPEEVRQKISNTLKGRKSPTLGLKHSEETRKKMSDSHKGRIPWNKGLTKEDPRVAKMYDKKESL
jgi:group I intron endonuclease